MSRQTTDLPALRRATLPRITYPDGLPVVERRQDIAKLIAAHQVLIVAGETGSGKTTQLPKICLELGRGIEGMIGHTQPRRLAARTVAQRLASELDATVGQSVGYQVRFTDRVAPGSHIKLMTDGILLAEIKHDRLLRRYDTLIIDEAHERSLNIDFLLGYLKQLLVRRPELKVIVTSATIDVDSFSRHFDNAPVIEVSGRSYPVQTLYQESADDDLGVLQQIAELVEEIERGGLGKRGDMLVFLSGEREIRELAKLLRRQTQLDVLPLYARLSHAEQNRVFDLNKRRGTRVVLATNVAETSLTVPGIRYVIDPGNARISRYSFRTKVQRLPVEAISQASANQRRGRCGRVEAGVCIRLYSEQDFNNRPEFTEPEIHRTNLASVILKMLDLGLGKLEQFPFINPPDSRMVRDGYQLLQELGAVTGEDSITPLGKRMSALPVDPRLARMALAATEGHCLAEVLVIISALSVQDPRERPADKQQQADQQHARFADQRSDFLAWLNLWQYYEGQRQSLSQNQLRKLCQREFLSFMRMREWRDIHFQMTVACRQLKLKLGGGLAEQTDYETVHRALLAGLLSNVAQQQEAALYQGCRNRQLHIFPGSSQFKRKPKWLMAAEIVETSKVYARQVAQVNPQWLLNINPSLLKHHYYEPRWQARNGRAVAYERITLYGLTLADKQVVHYGPIDSLVSRDLLIREGLVAGRCRAKLPFLKHNLALVAEVEDLESRSRRRDLLVDEQALFEFYHQRLPDTINTISRLQSALKRNRKLDQQLRMTRSQLVTRDISRDLVAQFPNTLTYEDMAFALNYHFEPGHREDGVSVTVPVALLNRVPRCLFDRLVPGLLGEKAIALIRQLPKSTRRHLVPAPDYAHKALAELNGGNTPLAEQLAKQFTRLSGQLISAADLTATGLEDYYRMNIRVVDAEGKLLAQGRDLDVLVDQFRNDQRQAAGTSAGDTIERKGLLHWDFDQLPQLWRFKQAGVDIVSYPALVDEGDSVSLRLHDYPADAQQASRLGVLRLLCLSNKEACKYLRKQLFRGSEASLVLAASQIQRPPLVDDVIDGAMLQVAKLDQGLPETRQQFDALANGCRGEFTPQAIELEKLLLTTFTVLGQVRQRISALDGVSWRPAVEDINGQIKQLFRPNFMRDTPAAWLRQYPRYMKALRIRLERLPGQLAKDQRYIQLLQLLSQPLQELLQQRPTVLLQSPEITQYRWMLEEFRVSLFAQSLGTQTAVSEKRLGEQWQRAMKWLELNPHG